MQSSISLQPPRARYGTAQPETCDGRLVLQGEVQWLLEVPSDVIAAAARAFAGVCEQLSDRLLLLDFGNAVGFFEMPGLGTIEVISGKADRQQFNDMLADLMEVASALPFAAAVTAALPYDRSVVAREDVLYHAFVYLRYALSTNPPVEEQLLPALQTILRDPHRRLERLKRLMPLELASRVEPSSLVRVTTGQDGLVAIGAHVERRLPLARLLRGHLPVEVEQSEVQLTYDTPENRFVKTFLDMAMGVIEGMREVARSGGRQSAFTGRIRSDCDAMARVLRPIIRHALWKEVGPMVHLPVASTVLQRRRGYRETLRHFSRLRLASRVPLERELVRDLLEAKDIAQLYELWCYFSLVRAVARRLGPPASAAGPRANALAITLDWDLEVAWADGTRLIYNPRFSRSRPAHRRSYSVPLRPDIALEVANGPNAGLHLLDAKFKVDALDKILSADETEDEGADEIAQERRGTFKRGDLYKMHTYRDATPRARSVWIVYPGTDMRFFSRSGVTAAPYALPATLEGVGALPLQPLTDAQFPLKELLLRLLSN